ncbi:MAG: hypothetical protein HYT80_09450 [Euryarchaeota archaeon]|nr:hypothetical protein [Euryarchaeota archaeon]
MVNLLLVYEYYLLAALLLGLVQIRNHLRLVRFALRVPSRWPHLLRIARENLHVVLTGPVLIVATLLLGTWAAAVVLRNFVFPAADVSPSDLGDHAAALLVAAAGGATMVGLDARGVLRAATFRPPGSSWLLDVTEAALAAEAGRGPVSLFVGWQVRWRLLKQLPFLQRWLWRRTLEIANRLTVGLALWWVWLAP